jgi:hypothetical protein
MIKELQHFGDITGTIHDLEDSVIRQLETKVDTLLIDSLKRSDCLPRVVLQLLESEALLSGVGNHLAQLDAIAALAEVAQVGLLYFDII